MSDARIVAAALPRILKAEDFGGTWKYFRNATVKPKNRSGVLMENRSRVVVANRVGARATEASPIRWPPLLMSMLAGTKAAKRPAPSDPHNLGSLVR